MANSDVQAVTIAVTWRDLGLAGEADHAAREAVAQRFSEHAEGALSARYPEAYPVVTCGAERRRVEVWSYRKGEEVEDRRERVQVEATLAIWLREGGWR